MKLTTLSTQNCHGGNCPTIYKTDRDTIVVQGNIVRPEEAGISVPTHEGLVEIPLALLRDHAGKLVSGQ